jgi:hypothetical protein
MGQLLLVQAVLSSAAYADNKASDPPHPPHSRLQSYMRRGIVCDKGIAAML